MRSRTSLNRKRFFSDPAFANARVRSAQFGEAAQLASQVYQLLPKEQRKRGRIGKLTGRAQKLLAVKGLTPAAALEQLKLHVQVEGWLKPQKEKVAAVPTAAVGPFNERKVFRQVLHANGQPLVPLSKDETSIPSTKAHTNSG